LTKYYRKELSHRRVVTVMATEGGGLYALPSAFAITRQEQKIVISTASAADS